MGTELTIEQIVVETEAHVRAYIAGMGVRLDCVDDIAQDVYLEFYPNRDKMAEDVEVLRWLKGIAKNLCLSHFRKQQRKVLNYQEAVAEALLRAESSWEKLQGISDIQYALDTCLQKVAEKNRKLIALRYEQDFRSERIAEIVKTTASAVRIRLHRVRAALKDCITHSLAQAGAS